MTFIRVPLLQNVTFIIKHLGLYNIDQLDGL